MNLVDRNLHPGEQIVFRTRLSPLVFIKPVIVFALFMLLLISNLLPEHVRELAGIALLFVVVPYALVVAGSFFFGDIAVTNQRVLLRMGLLRGQYHEVLLHKIVETEADAMAVRIHIAGGMVRSASFVRNPAELQDAIERARKRLAAKERG
jgi:hypothetical protein